MSSSTVCVQYLKDATYPSPADWFCPSTRYPEYRYDVISREKNQAYEMVREALHLYGMDEENYGSARWNPLGSMIEKGDTVVLKPNWVEDHNPSKNGGIECLITNTSVIRAVLDYVLIALDGTGKVSIADSPMPDCNFSKLLENSSVNQLIDWCKRNNIDVAFVDMRSDVVEGFSRKVMTPKSGDDALVDLGIDSYIDLVSDKCGRFRNGMMDAREMNESFHHEHTHIYGISALMLQADVVINLPKPKTHRKAGFTGALKNYIGACSIKRTIPHNVTGNAAHGGDEYNGPALVYGLETQLRDIENRLQFDGHVFSGTCIKLLRVPFFLFRRLMHSKYQGLGNWSGNDTIWRSVLDINRILSYVSKDGALCNAPQRKFFTLGDMIVSGEHNGPLEPDRKQVGMIVCAEDPVAFDYCIAKIMGFSTRNLPVLSQINYIKKFPMSSAVPTNIQLKSNIEAMNNQLLHKVKVPSEWNFIPAEGWTCLRE